MSNDMKWGDLTWTEEKCKEYAQGMTCPECGAGVTFHSDNSYVYKQKYGNGLIYVCNNYPRCDAYCGAHNHGAPLGTLANKATRQARMIAHQSFDRLFKHGHRDRRFQDRRSAYMKLSEYMRIPAEQTHIGMFNRDQCDQVIAFSHHCLAHYPHGSRVYVKNKPTNGGN